MSTICGQQYLKTFGVSHGVVGAQVLSALIEAAAVEPALDLLLVGIGSRLPARGGQAQLLLGVDGQHGARDGKLHQEQHEQDDHVLVGAESRNRCECGTEAWN